MQQYSLLALRFPMLLRLIKYCAATNQLDTVFESAEGRCAAIERWVREWGLNDEQQKELWGVVLDAFAPSLPRAACTRFFHSLGLILENFSHSFRIHAAHAATELHSFGVDALSLRGIGNHPRE